ncbi:MAG: ATP-binding protein [Bacilli bacterium]|nr:ATP-binding protein [Bacilli bacterium]
MIKLYNSVEGFEKNDSSEEIISRIEKSTTFKAQLAKRGIVPEDYKSNLPSIMRFYEDQNICAKCPGLYKCPKEEGMKHSQIELEKISSGVVQKIVCCPKLIPGKNPETDIYIADFPKEWFDEEEFAVAPTKKNKSVFSAIGKAIKDKDHPWIYLKGEKGSGKSFLAAKAAINMARWKKRGSFLDFPERMKTLFNYYYKEKGTYNDFMFKILTMDYLVLDNFGEEKCTQNMRDNVIFPLLYVADKYRLPIIFTSSKSLDLLKKHYSFYKDEKNEGQALVDLIRKNLSDDGILSLRKGIESYLNKK